MNVILYTRTAATCAIWHATLIQHGLHVVDVDIDNDQALCERFATCVPVVEIDGRVRFRGRVDPLLLRRILARPNDKHITS